MVDFLVSKEELHVTDRKIAVKQYRKEQNACVVNVRCHHNNFIKLRNFERFRFPARRSRSRNAFSACLLRWFRPRKKTSLNLAFIINTLYGAEIPITPETATLSMQSHAFSLPHRLFCTPDLYVTLYSMIETSQMKQKCTPKLCTLNILYTNTIFSDAIV